MTLRTKYDSLFKGWMVEYFSTNNCCWQICRDFYPKTKSNFAKFDTEEEAVEFMNWKYQKAEEAQKNRINLTNFIVPDNYYGQGRYYGD